MGNVWDYASSCTIIITSSLLTVISTATFIHVWNGTKYKVILKILALQIGASFFYVINEVGFLMGLRIETNNSPDENNPRRLFTWNCVDLVG